MRKRTNFLISLAALLFINLTTNYLFAYEAVNGPTRVLKYDRDNAYKGYTLIAPAGPGFTKVYLINMLGLIVQEWDLPGGGHTEILPNGHLLRLGATSTTPVNWGGTAGQINEYDSLGNLFWRYTNSDSDSVLHHTFHQFKHQDGKTKTFALVWEKHSYDEAVGAGRIKDDYLKPDGALCDRGTKCGGLWPDVIVELDEKGQETGWRWNAWEHLTIHPSEKDKLDINYHLPERLISNRSTADFMHANAVHYDAVNNLVLLCSRAFGEVYLIDYESRKIVGRWGNPWATDSGKEPSWMNDGDTKLWGPHGANFVASTPGSVNVLIFDNGWMRPEDRRSRVFEIKFIKVDSRWEPASQPVWQYQTLAQNSLLTDFQGFAQRLPNGNTLITSSGMGHLIEVTSTGKVVWEFISPVFANGEIKCEFSSEDGGPLTFFRAYRYGPDYPGLKGLKLKMVKPFNLKCPLGPGVLP